LISLEKGLSLTYAWIENELAKASRLEKRKAAIL